MTTDVFPFYGTIQQCWDVFFSEYKRLKTALGREPFIFEVPEHTAIHEYKPADGDAIYIEIRSPDNKDTLVNVEVEPKAGDGHQFTIFIHAHENTFREPGKSAIEIWKQIESVMRARGHLAHPDAAPPKPSLPPKPLQGANLDAWFDWYHAMLDSGYAITLKEIASETGYHPQTIRRKHSQFLQEKGLE